MRASDKSKKGGKGKSAPRGASAAVKKRSLKSSQGGPLPEDGSPIGAYPTGACVEISPDGGAPAWYLIRFIIGGRGEPHVGRLSSPPDRVGWNERMGLAVRVPANLVVARSCWPYRASAAADEGGESGDQDPLALAPVDGALMLSHLRGSRGDAPSSIGGDADPGGGVTERARGA